MKLKQLDDGLYVAPQIAAEDLAGIKESGITSIIASRPEGETLDQPSMETLRQAAASLGLFIHQIPVVPGKIAPEQVEQFKSLTDAQVGPVLAYCRTGARACTLWALNAAKDGRPVDEIMGAIEAAGHDLPALRARLQTISANSAA